MGIRSIPSTEQTRGSCTIVQVEVTNTDFRARDYGDKHYAWEFDCAACDAYSTMLTEEEAKAEMVEHTCPEIPPCEVGS